MPPRVLASGPKPCGGNNTLAKRILEKNIKPLCCSSLILKQTNCLDIHSFLDRNIFYSNIEAEICEILRIF